MSTVLVSAPVTLSEAGLSMIILEGELSNNVAEINRIKARIAALNDDLHSATQRYRQTQAKLSLLTSAIKLPEFQFYHQQ